MKKPAHFLGVRGGGLLCRMLILSCLSGTLCLAQKEIPPGVKSNGMGGAVVAVNDGDHSLQSTAALAYVRQTELASYYKNHYLLPELHTTGAYLVLPVKQVNLAAFAQQFGPEHYREQRVSLAAAHQIKHTALGIRIHWEQLAIEDFPAMQTITVELGGIVQLTPKLNFGGSLYNASLSSFNGQPLPVILRGGLSGQLMSDCRVSIEAEQSTQAPMILKSGVHYTINPTIQLLLGFRHPSNSVHGALCVKHHRLSVGYGLSWIMRLGLSQEFLLAYSFSSKLTVSQANR